MWFFISDCLAWLEPGDLYKIELGVTVSRAGFYVNLTQTFRNIDRAGAEQLEEQVESGVPLSCNVRSQS